ncbi:hypothetical protein SH467x_000236 [Pirellulaceae bacterium SH467]
MFRIGLQSSTSYANAPQWEHTMSQPEQVSPDTEIETPSIFNPLNLALWALLLGGMSLVVGVGVYKHKQQVAQSHGLFDNNSYGLGGAGLGGSFSEVEYANTAFSGGYAIEGDLSTEPIDSTLRLPATMFQEAFPDLKDSDVVVVDLNTPTPQPRIEPQTTTAAAVVPAPHPDFPVTPELRARMQTSDESLLQLMAILEGAAKPSPEQIALAERERAEQERQLQNARALGSLFQALLTGGSGEDEYDPDARQREFDRQYRAEFEEAMRLEQSNRDTRWP